jgi:hypothetical protein
MNLLSDAGRTRRIAPACMRVLSSTDFSLCEFALGNRNAHRLKPVLLYPGQRRAEKKEFNNAADSSARMPGVTVTR